MSAQQSSQQGSRLLCAAPLGLGNFQQSLCRGWLWTLLILQVNKGVITDG